MDELTPKKWRRTESRVLEPFRRSKHALEACRFAPTSSHQPTADQEMFILSEDQIRSELAPKFQLTFNTQVLEKEVDCGSADLQANLVIRDQSFKRYSLLGSWNLQECPSEYTVSPEELKGHSTVRGLDFSISLTLRRGLKREFGRPYHLGSEIATRTFSVRREFDEPQFPIVFRDAEYFKGIGLPETTLWHVQFFTEEYDRKVEEVLEVCLNKSAELNLRKMTERNVAGNLFITSLSTEIFFTICHKVFSSDLPAPQEQDGLLHQLIEKMQQRGGMDAKSLVAAARKDPSKLRAHVQMAFRLTEAIGSADLRRRYA